MRPTTRLLCLAAAGLLAVACSQPRPAPGEAAPLVLTAPPGDWAQLEGQRVRIDAPLVVTGLHELERNGTLVAGFGERPAAPTEIALPGADARAVAAHNARRSVLIEDIGQSPRTGSVLSGVEGVVLAHEGRYRLQPVAQPKLRPAPRPDPPQVAGDVRIVVLNLENLFNGDGRGGGFPTARGARSAGELARQLDRLVATVHMLEPDIVAAMELENDGYGPDSSIATLASALGGDWRFVDTGKGPGDDAIRVALLYRASAVRPVGAPAMLEGGPFGSRSRVPLAQAFRAGEGPAFTVVANHFKSKGCREAEGADRDQDDGQGCWNALRTDSARRLATWLENDPTGSGSNLAAIVGDLNAYGMEDPIRLLREAGWQDAFNGRKGLYTYVYDAQAGRLDHVFLSPGLAEHLRGAEIWHSNADESANIGYRAFNGSEQLATSWRSSDHDPILIGLDLRNP